ncbi:MAG: cytochrome C oxidase subunit IV family protein [Candidatus Omnitrophica bacterium]|nr:cytochrome C oxidase subunit IV family protein [Candidatus Omnitrophota bacterium]
MSDSHAPASTYLWIWCWLAGLMLLGVAFSALPLSKSTIALAILTLSTVKAALVVLYYMHLKSDRRVLALVAVFPLVVIALATLLVLSSRLVTL